MENNLQPPERIDIRLLLACAQNCNVTSIVVFLCPSELGNESAPSGWISVKFDIDIFFNVGLKI
jgi:hypothetical protein